MTAAARLSDVLRRVSEASPHAGLELGEPVEGDWWALPDAVAHAEPWHDHLTRVHGDRRVAATYLGAWLAEAPVVTVALPAVFVDVLVRVEPDRMWLRRHEDGWFDRHAIAPDLVEDGDGVLAGAADELVRLTTPVIEHVAGVLPVGGPALWGGVADALAGKALWLAGMVGVDQQQVWQRAEQVLDALQGRAPAMRQRPRLFPVAWSGGVSLHPVRGTCCLYYRTCDTPDPDGDGYCVTCPLRTDGSRDQRLRAHLEATAG